MIAYPAVIAPTLVVRLDFDLSTLLPSYPMEVTVADDAGGSLSRWSHEVKYQVPPPDTPALHNYWVLVQTLPLQLQRDGLYTISIDVGGSTSAMIRFASTTPGQQPSR
ncbi:MAG TPA: hypothetical protein VMM60_09895 [Ilumatobacter sp.]|nr:hypothetical protein [Ilumatobacter sp.]